MLARYVGRQRERPLGDAPDFARLPETARLADIDASRNCGRRQGAGIGRGGGGGTRRRREAPDWSAEISYAVRGSPYSNMVSLMFSIDLPWSAGTRQDREHAEVPRARRGARDTRGHAADASRGSRSDGRRVGIGPAQAQRIESELLPLAVQRRDAAQAAYRGGTGTLAAVLDARRAAARRRTRAHYPTAGRREGVDLAQFRDTGIGGIMTQISRAPLVAIAVVIVAAIGAGGGYIFGARRRRRNAWCKVR